MKRVILFYVFVVLFIQCKTTKDTSSEGNTLENTKWNLSEINGNPIFTPDGSQDAHFMLVSQNGTKRIQGFAGCNSIAGTYTASGKAITFTVASTKMMCPPEKMEIEDFFSKTLSTANSYKIEGEKLELYEDGTFLAKFKAAAK